MPSTIPHVNLAGAIFDERAPWRNPTVRPKLIDVERVLADYVAIGLSVINMQGVVFDPSGEERTVCTCGHPACASMGKHPLPLKGWNKVSGVVPVKLLVGERRRFWDRAVRSQLNWSLIEGPNYGIRVGASNLVALDVDPRNGGDVSLREFIDRHGALPLTVEDRSGNRQGGGHFYFRAPPPGVLPDLAALSKKQDVKAAEDVAPGLQLFQGNHLLVIPPSMHGHGRRYEWVHDPRDVPFAPVPQSIVDALWTKYNAIKAKDAERAEQADRQRREAATARSVRPVADHVATAPAIPIDRAEVVRRASRYVDRMPDAVSGMDGSRRTVRVACKLVVDFGLSIAEALPIMEDWNRDHCIPRWSVSELVRKLEWADARPGPRGLLLAAPVPSKGAKAEADGDLDLSLLDQLADMVKANPKSAENFAAAITVATRNDRSNKRKLRCCRPRSSVLVNLTTGAPRQQVFRCEAFCVCDGCRNWRIVREVASLTTHFYGAKALYEMRVGAVNYTSVLRWIQRQKGQYARGCYACDPLNFYLVTNVPHPDAIQVRAEVAVSEFSMLLHDWHEQERPISTSRGWKLPVPERTSEWRHCGMANRFLTLEIMQEIGAAINAFVEVKGGGEGKALESRTFVRDEWPNEIRDYAIACMQMGEWLNPLAFFAAYQSPATHDDPEGSTPFE